MPNKTVGPSTINRLLNVVNVSNSLTPYSSTLNGPEYLALRFSIF